MHLDGRFRRCNFTSSQGVTPTIYKMSKPKQDFWIINKTDAGYAEIFIYGIIGDGWSDDGVTASRFVQEFKKLEQKYDTIKIRINSNGGSIMDGIAMFNAIRGSKTNTEAYIDGVAASMALPVALACKQVYISKYGMIMTHRASGGCYGGAEDLKQYAKLMEDLEQNIISIIAERTGLSVEDAGAKYLGEKDRWINPADAVAEKLVDGIYDGEKIDAPKNATADQLVNLFETVLNKHLKTENQNPMNKLQLEITPQLLTGWGLPTDATADAVASAVNSAFAKAAKYDEVLNERDIAKAELNKLKGSATTDKVKQLLEDAQAPGKVKITNAQRTVFETDYATNPEGLEKLLAVMDVIPTITDKLTVKENTNDTAYAEMKDKSLEQLMQDDQAVACFESYPQLFKDKWVKAYGQESWDKSTYAKKLA